MRGPYDIRNLEKGFGVIEMSLNILHVRVLLKDCRCTALKGYGFSLYPYINESGTMYFSKLFTFCCDLCGRCTFVNRNCTEEIKEMEMGMCVLHSLSTVGTAFFSLRFTPKYLCYLLQKTLIFHKGANCREKTTQNIFCALQAAMLAVSLTLICCVQHFVNVFLTERVRGKGRVRWVNDPGAWEPLIPGNINIPTTTQPYIVASSDCSMAAATTVNPRTDEIVSVSSRM